MAPPDVHPVRLVVVGDLSRRRLTVGLRLLLAIPHLVWVTLYGAVALLLAVVAWANVVVRGTVPASLHRALSSYTRYTVHLTAYLCLAADPYPDFSGDRPYPVDVEIDPPVRQRRLGAAFRLVLALPALILSSSLGGSTALGAPTAAWLGGLLFAVSFLGWFACLARGRMPRGMRDAAVYAIGYGAQTAAYVLLLTGRYPDSTPGRVTPAPDLPPHPVAVRVEDDLGRPRLLVLFRLPLAVPHILWLTAWSAFAVAAVLVAWVAALLTGRVPLPLHRFVAANVRAWTHLSAFLYLVGRPFPGFVGRAGSYPIDVTIAPPERQRRAGVLLRPLLALPALVLASAYGGVALTIAVLAWFAGLAIGRMPSGLRDLGAASFRYQAQAYAYLFLLTPRYPDTSPALAGRPEPEIAPSDAVEVGPA